MSFPKVWVSALLASAGLLLGAGTSDAAKAKKQDALFAKLDANGDGKLSKAEFAKLKSVKQANKAAKGKKNKKAAGAAKAGKKKGTATKSKAKKGAKKTNAASALFTKLDSNKDGFLTPSEFANLKSVKKAAKGKKKPVN